MDKMPIKQIIKKSKLEATRIVYNYEKALLPSCKYSGVEYGIEFTYARPKDSEATVIKNIVERILDNIDSERRHIIAYKFDTSNVMRSVGGRYYWNSKFEDTGRNRCNITVLTDDGADGTSKPTLSEQENWIVLQPEKVQ